MEDHSTTIDDTSKVKSGYFKWTDEQKRAIASYLNENFKSYQLIGSNGGRKTLFLRKMNEQLKFSCTVKQLVNCFDSLIRKYKETKDKLNSTGFGIDPEKDKSIKEGFLAKSCPYFDILDTVLGERPNVCPPFIIQSGSEGENGSVSWLDQSSPDSEDDYRDLLVLENTSELDERITGAKSPAAPARSTVGSKEKKPKNSTPEQKQSSPEVTKFIRDSFSGIGVKRNVDGDPTPKNPITAFVKVLSDRMATNESAELQKLKLEREKFDHEKEREMKRAEDERESRDHELKKMKLMQDFELEKLKLQIELENIRKSS